MYQSLRTWFIQQQWHSKCHLFSPAQLIYLRVLVQVVAVLANPVELFVNMLLHVAIACLGVLGLPPINLAHSSSR